ncbi:uncharacterized protein LOC129587046 isoform X2 [Paramacrobiotus metropolitanus]|uniref:uncharacterized protein LOC129587046 isoform X2 n=1 Tax=Paramacrobiotus metropolitanus TaxID=2943436 RepID=UPI0024458703|nr:uncharacterized protein LOC129587046 isoform X2 [Paramacrobiotus metropolitanus]XP_055336599.1 uncharacterized protein LOC129587046 isoform X2 [Paramacrobiotus metropolitanus]XP_055336600.1 uncharacterized protein LOC129587046 isoform X2 [Paramacrobiotus metropolitanus]
MPQSYDESINNNLSHTHQHHPGHPQEESAVNDPGAQDFRGVVSRALAQPLEPSKRVFLYVNGDKYHTGLQYVLNPKRVRTWDGLLADWSDWIRPRFGAIRRVLTPRGGTEVASMHQLKNNGIYVVAGYDKNVREHQHGYPHEDDAPAAQPFYHHVNVNKVDQTYNKGVPKTLPVYLSGHAMPPYRHIPRVLITTIYRNGDDVTLPVKVTLRRYDLWNITRAKDAIGEKVRPVGGYVHSIRTLDGKPVGRVADLQNHGNYVVLGPAERFRRVAYEPDTRREAFIPISNYHRRPTTFCRRRFTIRLRKKTRSTTRLHPYGRPTARRVTPPYRAPQPLRLTQDNEEVEEPAKKSRSRVRPSEKPVVRSVRSAHTQFEDMDECHTAMCELPQEIVESQKIIRHIVSDANHELAHVAPSKTHSRINVPSIQLPEPDTQHTGSNTDLSFAPTANPSTAAIFGKTSAVPLLAPTPSRVKVTRSTTERSAQSQLQMPQPVSATSLRQSPSKFEVNPSRSQTTVAPSRSQLDLPSTSPSRTSVRQSPSRIQSDYAGSKTHVAGSRSRADVTGYSAHQLDHAAVSRDRLPAHASSQRDLYARESGEGLYQRSDELHTYFPFAVQQSLMEMVSDDKLRSPVQQVSSLNMLLPTHPSVMSHLTQERSDGWNDLSAESGTTSVGE